MGADAQSEAEPKVDVAVALIIRKDLKVLTVFNAKWGGFTLPMTKRRTYTDNDRRIVGQESWEDAAARAAAEVIEAPCVVRHADLGIKAVATQSHRDGRLKEYNYQVYKIGYDPTVTPPPPRAGSALAWLTPQQILASGPLALRPVASTAYELILALNRNNPHALQSGVDIPA
jgi:hypothetical protein